jgi:hypothetical protein
MYSKHFKMAKSSTTQVMKTSGHYLYKRVLIYMISITTLKRESYLLDSNLEDGFVAPIWPTRQLLIRFSLLYQYVLHRGNPPHLSA